MVYTYNLLGLADGRVVTCAECSQIMHALPAGVELGALNSFPAAVAVAAAAKSSHGPDSCVVAFTKIFPPLPCLSLTQSTHPTTLLSTCLIHILESPVVVIGIQILFLLYPLKPAACLA